MHWALLAWLFWVNGPSGAHPGFAVELDTLRCGYRGHAVVDWLAARGLARLDHRLCWLADRVFGTVCRTIADQEPDLNQLPVFGIDALTATIAASDRS